MQAKFSGFMRGRARELKKQGKQPEERRKTISDEVKQKMKAEMKPVNKSLIGHPEYVPQTIRLYAKKLRSPNKETRDFIRKELARLLGVKAIPLIAVGLNDAKPEVRAETISVLAGLKASNFITKIKDSLRDESPLVRSAAIRALSKTNTELLGLKFRVCLYDADARVRADAITALVNVSLREKIPAITEWIRPMLKDNDSLVREAASNALGKLEAQKTK